MITARLLVEMGSSPDALLISALAKAEEIERLAQQVRQNAVAVVIALILSIAVSDDARALRFIRQVLNGADPNLLGDARPIVLIAVMA